MIYINNLKIDVTIFPDKTSQVWKLPEWILKQDEVNIKWVFDNEGEFLHIAQLKMLLDTYSIKAGLYIPYLPYARQDKIVSNETTFALKTFANLLNSLNFNPVLVNDVHSSIAERIINNFIDISPKDTIQHLIEEYKYDSACFPDSGAAARYEWMALGLDLIYGQKTRNQSTGHIEKYSIVGEVLDKKILIVDDLCDAGMTFIMLTKELLKQGAKEVNLYTTHGIYSKGLIVLKESGINKIFSKDGEVSEVQNNLVYKEF